MKHTLPAKVMAVFAFTLIIFSCTRSGISEDQLSQIQGIQSKQSGLLLTQWPSMQDPGLPFYARIEPIPPHIYFSEGYAPIVFYRQSSTIPTGFNLLNMFDPPAAFSSPLHVEGSSLWHVAIGAGSPKIVTLKNSAPVEIWFVPSTPLLSLIAQSHVLTITDLSSISGIIKGHATEFNEINLPHPLPPFLGGGGHPNPKLDITAKGILEGGGNFNIHLQGKESKNGWERKTSINFQ
jgi:hypothetical protein